MTALLATIKHYWKFLLILTSICGSIVTASAWVSKVDVHVKRGNEKMSEFDQSQIGQARIEAKVDALDDKVDDIKDQLKEIKQYNERIERKLDRER